MKALKKFIVEYELPYTHRVQVGIQAEDEAAAIQIASEQFDAGSIWDDRACMPLLFDDYEENGDAGIPLEFEVVDVISADGDFPKPDNSVLAIRKRDHANKAAVLLLQACSELDTEPGGLKIDRDMLHAAYTAAMAACLVMG